MQSLLTGAAVSLLFTLFLTPLFIRLFHRLQWGQFIRDDGPRSHHAKRGTATMGGVVFILASVVGYFVGHLNNVKGITASGMLVLFLMVGLGLVGFTDDLLKTRNQRSLGLGGWAKIAGQVIVATVFAILVLQFPKTAVGAGGNTYTTTPATTNVSIVRDQWFDGSTLSFTALFGATVGVIVFVVWIWLIVAATSNGVNVTDGLDGLASGASIFAIGSFVIIGFWQFNQSCFNRALTAPINVALCYNVRDPLDLATVAACITGALIGFLWWNTSPAQIFMGDTGSLALGGALAALAVLSRTELLLLFIGGLFVIEPGSVIVQRVYFKLTRGKRIFLMSPIHHHFELKGWAEVTVVVRFWIIGGLLVAAGVGLFYLEWLTRAG
ncbi:phospho-N-acetylmuramoyl-pentapeptide-transferase [Amnibacterium kyonggiense]|uniref:Phospho-N-acetylmuramoyl-pentapeptide-transferase n=1 Tax=Amnibacterium kyonggiense TaxID=595671 RepID=A0A4R7FKV0_9MICO|nr:phospho-N-acetylmuramoyl-pentapeptide-transferase [Amnibacterium kyonggiense]TDS77021.1 phospho-N-acetylmuramoyl-pentapeptide-transferase [Amnibacterium kyonggiense]